MAIILQIQKSAFLLYSLLASYLLTGQLKQAKASDHMIGVYRKEVHLGLILDMVSVEGKMFRSSIETAISDFYKVKVNYTTRLVLHSRDSKGQTLGALSSAIDLKNNIKVQAIIGGQSTMEARLLMEFGEKERVPMVLLSDPFLSPSFNKHQFFVQISQHGNSQYKALAATGEAFDWRDVILMYDETHVGRDITHIMDSLRDRNINVNYNSVISNSFTDGEIIDELQKVKTFQTSVIVVHVSRLVLVSRLLSNAKKVGLMNKGFGWFMTATTMNLFQCYDSSTANSMEGVIGLKSYIPSSDDLRNLTARLKRKSYIENSNIEVSELGPPTIWAYDSIWALAKASERLKMNDSKDGYLLLKELLKTRLWGLSGSVKFDDGKLIYSKGFEIVNFVGRWHRRVGLLTNLETEIGKERGRHLSQNDLEVILWPGGSTIVPKGRSLMPTVGKLRIGVPVKNVFEELVKVNYEFNSNTTIFSGYCIEVFEAAVSLLPYQVEYEFIPVDQESSNDLVMKVFYKSFDAAVGDITIMSNRSQYVDFTLPFSDLGVAMLVADETKNMWIFLKPFKLNLWITTTAFFIITGFVVWIIEHPNNGEFQGSLSKQIGTIFWFGFSTLVFSHREKLLNNLSKFVVIVWVFAVLILTSSYTATLTSMMTIREIRLNGGTNYVGYQSGSFIADDNVINNLNFKGRKPLQSPEEFAEALSRGSNRGGVSAIVDEIPYIKIFLARYGTDRYSMIKSTTTTNGFGFAFRKDSPLVQDLSNAIMKLRETGELENLESKWFNSKSSLLYEDSSRNPNSLDLETFRGLFVITGSASGLALILFFVFYLVRNLRSTVMIDLYYLQSFRCYLLKYFSPPRYVAKPIC